MATLPKMLCLSSLEGDARPNLVLACIEEAIYSTKTRHYRAKYSSEQIFRVHIEE